MKLAARVTLAMMLVTARRERGDCASMYINTIKIVVIPYIQKNIIFAAQSTFQI